MSKKNLSLREESKTAANKHLYNKYLYNNLKALKEFEQFLEEAHKLVNQWCKYTNWEKFHKQTYVRLKQHNKLL